MAKKIEEADVKKECPSCGLGVALDSKICEFCGWDFEEEDEWILQIEKLERELMLEKQKFEPGSVEQKIEATLHSPQPSEKKPPKAPELRAAAQGQQAPVGKEAATAAPSPSERISVPKPVAMKEEAKGPGTKTVQAARPIAPEKQREPSPAVQPGPVRRVREVKGGQVSATSAESVALSPEGKSKKVRVVRKVKK